ncbi:MAG TPA: ABC transporter permease [Blastocatellia bacterium]
MSNHDAGRVWIRLKGWLGRKRPATKPEEEANFGGKRRSRASLFSPDVLVQDLRYGLRTLLRNPGFSVIAILTLALGIGANATVFGLVDSFLLRPLPVTRPDQLAVLAYRQDRGPLQDLLSIPEYQDIRAQSGAIFSDVLCLQEGQDGLTVGDQTEPMLLDFVSGNFFTALGIKPALGRFFMPGEGGGPGADPFIVLAYSCWQNRFGSDPSVIGKQVSINGHGVTVIGVAPPEFHGTQSLVDVKAYLPLSMMAVETWTSKDFMTNRGLRNLTIIGRLRSDLNIARASAALTTVANNIAEQHPDSDAGLALEAFPERLARPRPDPSNRVMKVAALFMILAALVLVLACMNVGNLLLVRATVRSREMALRAALGAGRARLIRQLLTETAMLALIGAAAGVITSTWAIKAIASVDLNSYLPVLIDPTSEWRLFVFAFGLAVITAGLVGIVPALRASRGNLNQLLREGGRTSTGGRYRIRNLLVAVQIAGSLTLLVVAGLLTRSLQNAERADLGFDTMQVLNITMDPHEVGYDTARGQLFYKQLLERVRALPGVSAAATAWGVPMSHSFSTDTVRVPGYQLPAGQPLPIIPDNFVSPGYFGTMRIPIISGRDFSDRDDPKALGVVIINQSMAEQYWPGQDPVGRSFNFADAPPRDATIVGIVKDSRQQGMAGPVGPAFYAPIDQVYPSQETLHVRTETRPEDMSREITNIVRELDPAMPVFDVQPMARALNTTRGLLVYQFGALLAASLGILGLLLAVIGVYGVVSYGASQRTQEIGVRMALGARPGDVLRMILGQGVAILAVGLAIGLIAAVSMGRLVANFLVGIGPTDPLTYVVACAVLALVSLVACYLPARRAMRIELTEALR